jgi:hemoglobin
MSDEVIPTLYEWVGGERALERLTSVFYQRVAQDPLIGPLFAHMDADHPKIVAQFIAEVFGGPATYSRERGGHHAMIMKHVGRHLTEAQRSRWMGLLLQCADEVGLTNDPEFRSAFVAYIEWGTRLAVVNSQADDVPDVSAAMPKWGWGETGGPYRG